LGLDTASDQVIEADVVNAIARVTGGNFRLIQLFAQIERVLVINNLHIVTTAVVDAARESLVVSAL
jgi:hypothetical protein